MEWKRIKLFSLSIHSSARNVQEMNGERTILLSAYRGPCDASGRTANKLIVLTHFTWIRFYLFKWNYTMAKGGTRQRKINIKRNTNTQIHTQTHTLVSTWDMPHKPFVCLAFMVASTTAAVSACTCHRECFWINEKHLEPAACSLHSIAENSKTLNFFAMETNTMHNNLRQFVARWTTEIANRSRNNVIFASHLHI